MLAQREGELVAAIVLLEHILHELALARRVRSYVKVALWTPEQM